MKMIIGEIRAGMVSYNPAVLREYASRLKDGTKVLIVVEKLGEPKSRRALGYYWKGMVAYLSRELGWEKPRIHKWFKKECAFDVDVSDMDQTEFSAYIDRCRRRAEEIGYPIPSPDEFFKLVEKSTR